MKVAAVVVGCALPVAALLLYFAIAGDARVIAEGGVWSLGVIGLTMIVALAAPPLCAFTKVPRVVWMGVAGLPVVVGVAGALHSVNIVAGAIASISPGDKLVMAAVGAGEVASLLSLALLVGGAGVFSAALVALVVERGPGAVLLVTVSGTAMVLGVRWLVLREALMGMASVSAADKMTIVAAALSSAQVLGFAVVGVAVLLLVGGLASLLRPGDWVPLSSTVGMAAVAGGFAAAIVGAHVSLSGLPALASIPLPTSELVVFLGDASDVPGVYVKSGGLERLGGEPHVVVVDAGARGIDVRRGLTAMQEQGPFSDDSDRSPSPSLRRIKAPPSKLPVTFVGPPPKDAPRFDVDDLSMPMVLAPLFRDRTRGVSTTVQESGPCRGGGGDRWPCGADLPFDVVILGPSRPSSDFAAHGVRYRTRAEDGDLELGDEPAVLAFDDDVDAAVFASVLSRLAKPRAGLETPLLLALSAPPSIEELKRVHIEQTADVDGALDKAVIARVVRAQSNSVKACYERELTKNPNLAGRVLVRFTIDGRGRSAVDDVEAAPGLEALVPCLESRVQTWLFPAPAGGGVVHVSYPFVFNAE
jgi:hypothetical protein